MARRSLSGSGHVLFNGVNLCPLRQVSTRANLKPVAVVLSQSREPKPVYEHVQNRSCSLPEKRLCRLRAAATAWGTGRENQQSLAVFAVPNQSEAAPSAASCAHHGVVVLSILKKHRKMGT